MAFVMVAAISVELRLKTRKLGADSIGLTIPKQIADTNGVGIDSEVLVTLNPGEKTDPVILDEPTTWSEYGGPETDAEQSVPPLRFLADASCVIDGVRHPRPFMLARAKLSVGYKKMEPELLGRQQLKGVLCPGCYHRLLEQFGEQNDRNFVNNLPEHKRNLKAAQRRAADFDDGQVPPFLADGIANLKAEIVKGEVILAKRGWSK